MLERVKENIKVFVQVNQPTLWRRCTVDEQRKETTKILTGGRVLFSERDSETRKGKRTRTLFFFCVFARFMVAIETINSFALLAETGEAPRWRHTLWSVLPLVWKQFPYKTLIRNANYHLYFHVGNSGVCFGSDIMRPKRGNEASNKYACLFSANIIEHLN